MFARFFAVAMLFCTGCATQYTAPVQHYNLVDVTGQDYILPPPDRNNYDARLYNNPDLPFVVDLRSYRDYIDRQIVRLETRSDIQHVSPVSAKPVAVEPEFHPRDPDNHDLLLEDALAYASQLRKFHRSYVKEVERSATLAEPSTDRVGVQPFGDRNDAPGGSRPDRAPPRDVEHRAPPAIGKK